MKSFGWLGRFAVAAIAALLSGCLVASAPVYPGDMSDLPDTPVLIDEKTAKGRMKMRLPEGWKPANMPSHASNWSAEISGAYEKDMGSGSAELVVTCYTSFISKDGVAEALRDALDPRAVKAMGPYLVDGPSMLDPEFELYDLEIINEGKKWPMSILIAWKLDSGVGSCKYGLQMAGMRWHKEQMLKDMLAILKTLS